MAKIKKKDVYEKFFEAVNDSREYEFNSDNTSYFSYIEGLMDMTQIMIDFINEKKNSIRLDKI